MTVTLRLPPDLERCLLAEAESRGVPLDALLEMLIWQFATTSVHSSSGATDGMMVKLGDGMWALRTGYPISADTVNDTIDTLRRERNLGNLGLFG
jgi:hypothetical protein